MIDGFCVVFVRILSTASVHVSTVDIDFKPISARYSAIKHSGIIRAD